MKSSSGLNFKKKKKKLLEQSKTKLLDTFCNGKCYEAFNNLSVQCIMDTDNLHFILNKSPWEKKN